MTFIDAHAHLTSEALYPHIDAILERAKKAGVEKIVNICTDKITLERGLELAQKYPWVYNAAATTPHDVLKEGQELFPLMANAARNHSLVAVGETGLDYHYWKETSETQKEFLKRYFELALSCQLPIVIHCREAFDDFFEILDRYYPKGKGVLHCFTGTLSEVDELIKRDWYVSFSGIVTYKKSDDLREAVRRVPIHRLLIETDAPYLAPQAKRGEQNEPSFLPYTAEVIAMARAITLHELAQATTQNASEFFSI